MSASVPMPRPPAERDPLAESLPQLEDVKYLQAVQVPPVYHAKVERALRILTDRASPLPADEQTGEVVAGWIRQCVSAAGRVVQYGTWVGSSAKDHSRIDRLQIRILRFGDFDRACRNAMPGTIPGDTSGELPSLAEMLERDLEGATEVGNACVRVRLDTTLMECVRRIVDLTADIYDPYSRGISDHAIAEEMSRVAKLTQLLIDAGSSPAVQQLLGIYRDALVTIRIAEMASRIRGGYSGSQETADHLFMLLPSADTRRRISDTLGASQSDSSRSSEIHVVRVAIAKMLDLPHPDADTTA